MEKYSEKGSIDWKTFNYYQFDADWSECSFEEISKLQTRAVLRFYARPDRFIKMLSQLKLPQYTRAIKRLGKILFNTEFYNSSISKEGKIEKKDSLMQTQQIPSM